MLDLMVSVTVAGILLGVGVPSFISSVRSSAMVASTNQLVSYLHSARSEAIKRHARVTVCRGTTGNAPDCDENADGLLIFVNANDDASVDGEDEVLQASFWLDEGLEIRSDDLPGYITYDASGFSVLIGGQPATGELVFCDIRGDDGARVLDLSVTGRPQIQKREAGSPSCE
ncbi:MAG: GspH/FimT family pseudopilin [Pseudomonadota bacterium]